jgi:indolepyruvate ferredoxin oxidoreductase
MTKFRHLRGGALDPFARSADRKLDRTLIADYERIVEEIIAGLETGNHEAAIELAALPEHIRGYGHIRERYVGNAKKREGVLLAAFRNKETPAEATRSKTRKVIPVLAG